MTDRSAGGAAAWWRGAVVYQIYPRSFRDGNGDGIGDLAGIRQGLAYVAALGVDAVWISPFFVSPQRDFGYDVADYTAVDPMFGTLADFDAILAEAHALGLKVIIDQVWSHSSDQHPWFEDSRRALHGPRSDWYVWADPQADGTPPNNWLGVFGGGAWTWEPRRHQYYLHHFLPSQPALNLRNPAVRTALLDTGRFWLERGVDGFRLDAIDFMLHDPGLANNPSRHVSYRPLKPFSLQRHIHDMAHEDTLDLLAAVRRLVDEYGAVTMAEVGSESCQAEPLARAALYTRGIGHMHTAYSLRMMKQPGNAAHLHAFIAEAEAELGDGWLTWAFSNHDVIRVATRWGLGDPAAARAYMALLLTLRGTICLYQGEELGLIEADLALEDLHDPFGIAMWPEYKGRDGCRTPVPWVATEPHGGFCPPSATPWLPVPDGQRVMAVDGQAGVASSMLEVTRGLIRWRKAHEAFQTGDLTLGPRDEQVLSLTRQAAGSKVHVSVNLSDHPAAFGPTDASIVQPVPGLPGVLGDGYLAPWGAVWWLE